MPRNVIRSRKATLHDCRLAGWTVCCPVLENAGKPFPDHPWLLRGGPRGQPGGDIHRTGHGEDTGARRGEQDENFPRNRAVGCLCRSEPTSGQKVSLRVTEPARGKGFGVLGAKVLGKAKLARCRHTS